MASVRSRARRAAGILPEIFLALTIVCSLHVALRPAFTAPASRNLSSGSVPEPAKFAAPVAGAQVLAAIEETRRGRVAHRDVSRSVGADVDAPQPQNVLARSNMLMTGALGAVSLALGRKRKQGLLGRGAGDSGSEAGGLKQLASTFCNFFALWLTIVAVVGLKAPSTLNWVPSNAFTMLLGLLMFSVGITTSIDDFKECLNKPGTVAINFIACYGIMPVLAFVLGKAIGATDAILAGMVLVGSVNGGQASNLCTLIAGGDVALSVLMTTSTTLGCTICTPLICKAVLGAVVPIDTMGIVMSTLQVVIAPIFLGVLLNTLAPKQCNAAAAFTPTIGVIATVILVGASVAKCAEPILGAGLPLQFACLGLHLFGGILGFLATKACGYDVRTCRTCAIETAMKSSAFGFLLASLHFGSFNARVPSAVSVVWMAITGSLMAVYWKGKPVTA